MKTYEVSERLMDLLYLTFQFYANRDSYYGTPERLNEAARMALEAIDRDVFKRTPDRSPDQPPVVQP